MAKHLLLAVFTVLCFISVRAQNAFDDAVLLYEWKNNNLTDSGTLTRVGRILGNKDTLSFELAKLKSIYLSNVFDAKIKIDKENVYEKVIAYVSKNLVTDNPTLEQIKTKHSRIEELKNSIEKWKNVKKLDSIPPNTYADSTVLKLKKDCKDPESKTCLDTLLRNKLAKDIENGTNEIKTLEAEIAKHITSLSKNDNALVRLNIVKEIKGFVQQVRDFKKNQPAAITIANNSGEKVVSTNTASLSNFKMPGESEIIDAVAIYLAKRVKQEAVIFFVENLKEKIDSAKLTSIFPETARKFREWKPYSAPSFDNSWRYAFSKDLVKLPRLGFDYLKANPAIIKPQLDTSLNYIMDALLISEKVTKHYNFLEIVESLANDQRKMALIRSDGLRAFLRLTYIINQELYEANETKDYWITSDRFNKTMNNDEVMRIFFELIVKKYPDIVNYIDIRLTNLQGDDLYNLKSWISNVLLVLNHFQENQNQILNSDTENFNVNSYWSNLNEVINTVLSQRSELAVIRNSGKFEKGLEKANELFEVYQLLQGKNYAAAANNCVGLMISLIDEKKPGANKFKTAAELVAFSSEILQAKSKEQVTAAIESYALPPTSYRLKQNFSRVISIGAYFGPYAGMELIRDECPGLIVGFSAPLTLDFTFNGNYDKPKSKSYTTWSIIVFDLGSVVSYRLTHSGGGLPEKARWAQLFSPGVAVRFGLGNTPLVFSAGAQMNPQLRDFRGGERKDAIRISTGLFIDMPLLMLHKK